MIVRLYITPQKQTVDAPGSTVLRALHQMGFTDAEQVAIGKYQEFEMLDEFSPAEIEATFHEMCSNVALDLVNPIMEEYRLEIVCADGQTLFISGKKRLRK